MIVSLMRRASFSAAHSYWLAGLDASENRLRFGKWAAREPHGHNYRIEVAVSGEVDLRTGMVVNITDVNHAIKQTVTDVLDGRFLNRDVPFFETNSPSIENIAQFIWDSVGPHIPGEASITAVKVWEMDTLWTELNRDENGKMISTLTRSYDFSASHRLHSPHLSDDENREIFGKCNNPNGHGHNYEIAVSITGDPDPLTGMLFPLEELDKIVDEEILIPFDHKHLNLDTPDFADVNPTSEMLAVVIWQKLARRLPTTGRPRLHSVVVNETARNSFEYRG